MKKIFKIISSFTFVVILALITSSMPVSRANNLSEENLSALIPQTENFVHIFCRSTLFANCYGAQGTCDWWAHGEWHCVVNGYREGTNPGNPNPD